MEARLAWRDARCFKWSTSKEKSMNRLVRSCGFALFAVALLLMGTAEPMWAQQVFGSIFGTVTDPTGSAVANAKVTITDVNKGTQFSVTTNDSCLLYTSP